MKLLKTVLLGIVVIACAVPGCSRRSKTSSADLRASSPRQAAAYEQSGSPSSPPVPAQAAGAAVAGSAAISRKVIKTADLELVAGDVQKTEADIERIVEQSDGFVLNSEFTGQRQRAIFHLALRVPADRFTAAVDAIARLGKIDRKNVKGEDVTDEYVDLKSDLASAERIRKEYFDLLARAQKVSDALEVERELERVGGEIERIKGRIVVIDNQVALSTINVTLRSAAGAPLVDFGRGFIQTLRVLVRFLVILLYVIVFLVGVAVPVVLVLYLVRFIVRKLKRKP